MAGAGVEQGDPHVIALLLHREDEEQRKIASLSRVREAEFFLCHIFVIMMRLLIEERLRRMR